MPTYPTYKLGELAEILDSFRKPINSTERAKRIQGKSENELYPYYGATGQVGLIDEYLIDGEYVLVGEDGAPCLEPFKNKSYIIKGKAWVNNHAHIILGKKGVACNQYLNYYLNSFDYKDYVNGTTRLKLTQGNLVEIPIPLPPLSTQHQIVSRIESLFAELDKAVEHLRTAQQQLKIYRSAVLNHWLNNEDGKWETVKLGEVAEVKRGRSKHRPRNDKSLFGGKYPFIQTGEIREAKGGTISTYSQTYSEKGLEQSRLWPKGTLCLTIAANIAETAYLGFGACFPDSVVGIIARQDRLNLDYFNCYIQLIKQMIEQQASATAQKNINVDYLDNLQIPLPPLPEQQRIVKEIEMRLSQAEAAEARIAEALQKTEALRQSILKKAFSGELV